MSYKTTPLCLNCGINSKLVSFVTFEYFYCPSCKEEVLESGKPAASSVNWINAGDKGICDNCGSDIIEAINDIKDAPTIGSMITLIDNFKRTQTNCSSFGFYDCASCNSWVWNTAYYGCSKFDNNLNRLLLNIQGKGWV